MFKKFNLKGNPFRVTPSTTEELYWAGFNDVKNKFDNRIKKSINIPNSTLVLNWGEYGSGKTHSARYFSQSHILQNIAGNKQIPYSLVLNLPNSKDPIKDLYTRIVDNLNIVDLRKKVSDNNINVEELKNNFSDNQFIQSVIVAMLRKESNLFADDNDSSFKSYLYGNIDSKQMKSLGINRKMSSNEDYLDFLSALFFVMTYEGKMYSSINLWIDEFEDIALLTLNSVNGVNNFIRTLLDKTSDRLLIFLNLTQSAMVGVEDLSAYLQDSVMSRIKERIELPVPAKNDLKKYLSDLLGFYRDEQNNANSVYYPFDEKVVDELINDIGNDSLRRYNEAFSLLLESAIFDNCQCINLEYYETIKSDIVGWK